MENLQKTEKKDSYNKENYSEKKNKSKEKKNLKDSKNQEPPKKEPTNKKPSKNNNLLLQTSKKKCLNPIFPLMKKKKDQIYTVKSKLIWNEKIE